MLLDGAQATVYGKLGKEAETGRIKMIPEFVMDGEIETFLRFLDKRIVKQNQIAYVLGWIGAGIFVFHVIYFVIYPKQRKTEILEIEA